MIFGIVIQVGVRNFVIVVALVFRFISFVAAYMIFGIAIQVGVRKKRGVESIPNSEFWTGLPSTIKVSISHNIIW